MPLERVGVQMFAEGLHLPEEGTRRSLKWIVAELLGPQATGPDAATDLDAALDWIEPVADLLAGRRDRFTIAARAQSRERVPKESPTAVVASAWTNLLLGIQGHDVPDEALTELAIVFGGSVLADDEDLAPLAAELRRHLQVFSFDRLIHAATNAPVGDLRQIRDSLLEALQFLPEVQAQLEEADELRSTPFAASLGTLTSVPGICLSVLGRWARTTSEQV